LADVSCSWYKQAAAAEELKLAKLQLDKHNGDQAMKIAKEAMTLQAMKLSVIAFLVVLRNASNENT